MIRYNAALFACLLMMNPQGRAQKTNTKPKAVKPAATVLKNSTDSLSYAMGANIAAFFRGKGVDQINAAVLRKAVEDVYAANTSLIIPLQQCDQIMQEKMQSLQQKLQAAAKTKIDAEKEKGRLFLENNKTRPGVITLPSGLQYEVLKSGAPGSPQPLITDTVLVHYAGSLIDGTPFDDSFKRGTPLKRVVAGFIRGWTEILQLMHKGDRWKVYVPNELGYGDRGAAGAGIAGGAALVFEMELIGINPGN